MTKRQINKLRMYRMVREFVASISDVLKTAPMYESIFRRFNELISAIESAADYQANGVTGKKEAQLSAQQRMLDMLDIVGGVLLAYAKTLGDKELMAKAGFKRGRLERMRLIDSLRIAESVYNEAAAVKEHLSEYWLDGRDVLADFRTALNEANSALAERSQSIVTRVSLRLDMMRLFNEMEGFLADELDNFLEQYLQKNPDVLQKYVNARQTRWFGMKRWRRSELPAEVTTIPADIEAAATQAARSSEHAATKLETNAP